MELLGVTLETQPLCVLPVTGAVTVVRTAPRVPSSICASFSRIRTPYHLWNWTCPFSETHHQIAGCILDQQLPVCASTALYLLLSVDTSTQVIALICHCLGQAETFLIPAPKSQIRLWPTITRNVLLLLCTPPPMSWQMALMNHHWINAASIMRLPPGTRVGSLIDRHQVVLLLYPGP